MTRHLPSGTRSLMPCRSAGRLDRALGVGDVAVAVFPHREDLEPLLLGLGRERRPEHVLLDALHVLAVLHEVGHLEHAEQVDLASDITVEGSAMSTRAELELLQQLLVAAELARAEHHDLGLAAELGVGALGEFLGAMAANSEPGSPTWPNLISVCASTGAAPNPARPSATASCSAARRAAERGLRQGQSVMTKVSSAVFGQSSGERQRSAAPALRSAFSIRHAGLRATRRFSGVVVRPVSADAARVLDHLAVVGQAAGRAPARPRRAAW